MLEDFLNFLAEDIVSHPERLRTIDASLVERVESLVGDVDIDLDAPLPADSERSSPIRASGRIGLDYPRPSEPLTDKPAEHI